MLKKLLLIVFVCLLSSFSLFAFGSKENKQDSPTFPTISFEDGEKHYAIEFSNEGNGVVTGEYVEENQTHGEKSLKATFEPGNWPGVRILPTEVESWDLSDEEYSLGFDIYNYSKSAQPLYFKYDTVTKAGNGKVFRVNLAPNARSTVYILNTTEGASIELGMQTLPQVEKNTMIAGEGWTEAPGVYDQSLVTQITIWMFSNTTQETFGIDNIRYVKNPFVNPEKSYANMLDEFGQYTKQEWENKITREADLIKSDNAEKIQLENWLAENNSKSDRTIYGGWKNEALKQKATGHFYTTKIDNKWTLIDPLGYLYFATGVDILRTADMNTWVSSREYMFENLPKKDSALGDHYSYVAGTVKPPNGLESGNAYNFYTANLERKYGDNWLENWVDMAMLRLKAWGMTSIGNWADPELFFGKGEENGMTYVANAWSHEGGDYKKITAGTHSIADPFDPAFETALDASLVKVASYGVNDDPYCMGIYVDNEIGWGNAKTGNDHYISVTSVFAESATGNFAKKAFIEMLKEKYETIDNLNDAWGTGFGSFNFLQAPLTFDIPQEDLSYLFFALTDKYYSTVDKLLEKHLPNILNLGSRLADWGTSEEVVLAAAKYVDVMSFNCYKTDAVQDFMDLNLFDLPLIIGEFHFTATDHGFFAPGLVPVTSSKERGIAYEEYAKTALMNEKFVGIHWFQYYDQPTLGRAWDGENTNTGFVDVTDQSYTDLVNSARKINQEMYTIRFND